MAEYDKICFSEEEKCKAFDRIADEYFKKNFGNMTKQDMEILMFDILLLNLFGDSEIIDYNNCSNYNLSKQLGITESRVNNLKIKRELKYPDKNFKWEQSFAKLIENSKYTVIKDRKLKMNIPDPNLYIAIRNFIEENGGYVECHLNSKILDIKIEYLLDFALKLEEDADDVKKNIIGKIRKENRKENLKNVYSIGREVLSTSTDMMTILSAFTPGNIIISTIKNLSNYMKGQTK